MRLHGRVHLVGGGVYGLSHFADCNVYALDCGSSTVLLDSGCGIRTDVLVANLQEAGLPPLDRVLLTHSHWDHARGGAELQEGAGARLAGLRSANSELGTGMWSASYAARNGARPVRPTALDEILEDGEVLNLGPIRVTVIATPGHSGDSACFLVEDAESGVRGLVTGDTVQTPASLGICTADTDFQGLRNSIHHLLELGADALYPGHGPFALRGGVMQLSVLDRLMSGPWSSVVGGYPPMGPSWWVMNDPRQITDWRVDPTD